MLRNIKAILQLFGVEFWILSLAMFYTFLVLSSHIILPWQFDNNLNVVISALSIFAFSSSSLLLNEYGDMDTDRYNERKSLTYFLRLRITGRSVYLSFVVMAVISAVLAYTVNLAFFILIIMMNFVSIIYSHPPVRLKARPFLDMAVNTLLLGVLLPISGWVVWSPVSTFPWPVLIPLSLFIMALYAVTAHHDHDADKHAGLRTSATVMGNKILTLGKVSLVISYTYALLGTWLLIFPWTRDALYLSPMLVASGYFYFHSTGSNDAYRDLYLTIGFLFTGAIAVFLFFW